jgi:hypothetical protein
MSRKRDRRDDEAPLVEAALGLQEAFEEIERLTARSAEVEVSTWGEIVRAAELLNKATAAHHRFAQHLTALSESVAVLRDRHNAAIEILAQQAARVDAQRPRHDALEERFKAIAAAALQVDELTKAIPVVDGSDPTASAAAVSAGFAAVREGLGRAIDEARSVETEAKEAGLADLGKRAVAIRQQLESLVNKIAGVVGRDA